MIKNITKALHILEIYHESFQFSEYSDKGTHCYKPYRDNNLTVVNQMIAEVRNAMPKYGDIHKSLSASIADDLGIKHVQYDWLTKAIARLLAGIESEEELQRLGAFSQVVRLRMQAAGKQEIHSLSEVGL